MSNERAGSVQVRVLAESPAAFSAEHADEAGRSIDEVARRIAPAADGSVRIPGIFGTALFYSDGVITLMISAPSAEGVKVAEPLLKRWVVPISVTILLVPFIASIAKHPPARVPGIAVSMTANLRTVPHALLHSLKHFKVLHARNVLLSVETLEAPFANPAEGINMRDPIAQLDFKKILTPASFRNITHLSSACCANLTGLLYSLCFKK